MSASSEPSNPFQSGIRHEHRDDDREHDDQGGELWQVLSLGMRAGEFY